MKKIVSIIILICSISAAAFAQEAQKSQQKPHQNYGERMLAERVAYITQAMQLTEKEAQVFWPIYNRIEAQQRDLVKAEREAFKNLGAALKENKEEKEISALLDKYVAAQQANVNLHTKYIKDYKKVLSAEKVAKFLKACETFRRQQIQRLQGSHKPGTGFSPAHHNFNGQKPQGNYGHRPQENFGQKPQGNAAPEKK